MEGAFNLETLLIALLVVLVLVLLLTVGIMGYSYYKYGRIMDRQRWKIRIDDILSAAIVNSEVEVDPELNRYSPLRNQLLSTLVDATRRFSGNATEEIRSVFEAYGLEVEIHKKLRHRRAHWVAGGIQEAAAMHLENLVPRIEELLHHRSPIVYQEAQFAMVKFQGFEGLNFLDSLDTPLSEWQQLRLLSLLKGIPAGNEDRIVRWLHSSNPTIVLFILRLISKLQQLGYYDEVKSLQGDVNLRVQQIKTLEALENPDTVPYLIVKFEKEEPAVQEAILQALKYSRLPEASPFLEKQLCEHPSSVVRLQAAEALHHMGRKDELKALLASGDADLKQIVYHVLREKNVGSLDI
jgi:hypothetical protein